MTIDGIVLDEEGRVPVPFVAVEGTADPAAREGDPWTATGEALSDPGGRFTLELPGAGPVLLRALPADEDAGGAVELAVAKGTTEVRIRLAPQPVLELDLRDGETGEPVRGPVRLTRGPAGAEDRPTVVFDTRDVPEGAVPGIVFPAGPTRIEVTTLGYRVDEVIEVELRRGERHRVRVEARPDPGSTGEVRVHYRDADGNPVPAHEVPWCGVTTWALFEPLPPEEEDDGSTLRFRAAAGVLEISAGADPEQVDASQAWIRDSVSCVLEAGATADATLTLRRGGWVRIRGPEEDPGSTWFLRGGEVRVETWTGGVDHDGGHWTVGPLPPGEWTASFPEGSGLADLEFTLVAGRLLELPVRRA